MTHDYYHVQEWRPEVRQLAEDLMSRIHEAAPEVGMLFMGAAALGLPGKNDIDLDLLCHREDVERYAHVLAPILGEPQELNYDMAVWSYMEGDIEIDCILSDQTTSGSHVPAQKRVFEKLRHSAELRERYTRLKYECDGLPYADYEAKKKAFLQQIEQL